MHRPVESRNGCLRTTIFGPTIFEIFLRGKGLLKYVDGSICEPNEDDKKAPVRINERKRDMALMYLLISIDTACKSPVLQMRDPKLVWITFRKSYHLVSEASTDAKLSALQDISMDNSESIIQY